MILWKDFILDDFFGPSLLLESETSIGCREARTEDSQYRQEDAGETQAGQIQETGQLQRPARMVGFSRLDSNNPGPSEPLSIASMEAQGESRDANRRHGRGGTG